MKAHTISSGLLIYHDLIAAIVAAMEARDTYTASHSRRVSDMSEAVCGLLRLPEDETVKIHIAADIHDIGKIGIADSVLMRNGPLDDDEWQRMKKHPLIGYDILMKVTHFGDIAQIVRYHHERWDGMGYPDGLRGEDIPLGARIIAIADSIDAMLSNRTYRPKMDEGSCKAEIIKNKAAMYDPFIVNTVLKNWDEVLRAGARAMAAASY